MSPNIYKYKSQSSKYSTPLWSEEELPKEAAANFHLVLKNANVNLYPCSMSLSFNDMSFHLQVPFKIQYIVKNSMNPLLYDIESLKETI